MPDLNSIPLDHPGKFRWELAVEVERIRLEAKEIIKLGTSKARGEDVEFAHWRNDLRRGRTNILGGFFRFVDGLDERGLGLFGLHLALRLLELGRRYVDLKFPERL